MQWWCVLPALLAAAGAAQPSAPDPFGVPAAASFADSAAPGARERFAESLALEGAALAQHPADVAALERATTLLERLNRSGELIERVRAALKGHALPAAVRSKLQALLGHLLVVEAERFPRGQVIVFGGGGNIQIRPQRNKEAIQRLAEAIALLRVLRGRRPGDLRLREDLARALDRLDNQANADEIRALEKEAAALRRVEVLPRPEPVAHTPAAAELRARALAIEQAQDRPDHAAALRLRKRALVVDFCDGTLPFSDEEALFEPVSLLASRDLILRDLTRTYKNAGGGVGRVPPQYFAPDPAQRVEIVRGLGTDAATPILLAVIRDSRSAADPVAEAALETLSQGDRPTLRKGLARLLAQSLLDPEERFAVYAQRRLVKLAGSIQLDSCVALFSNQLHRDTSILIPLDLARALGAIGNPAAAPALLALAENPDADVYFRRQAVLALGRVAPEKLDALPDEPLLALARAAARYRISPSEELRGAILEGLGREHEADDAARLCAELQIREAIPLLERFLAEHKDHYAAATVRTAYQRLTASG